MHRVLKFIFPDYCLSCRNEVDSYGLCSQCFRKIKFITENSCKICSFPFEYEDGFDKICGKCLETLPTFDRNISVFRFDEVIKNLIVHFKYQDQHIITKYFVNMLRERGRAILKDTDVICPVPMHWFKVLERNFNQSSILANSLASLEGIKYQDDLLVKDRYTRPQAILSAKARMRNIKGAFSFSGKYDVSGKNVLIVDDVYTTGSTLNECAKQLIKANCNKVYTLTLAKRVFNS
jgi:ComF family protein